MIKTATYVSVWDGGTEVRTSCQYDTERNMVFAIETADILGLESLDDEYVELPDGTEIRDFINEDE